MTRMLLPALLLTLAACGAPADPPETGPAPEGIATAVDPALLGGYHWRLSASADARGEPVAALHAPEGAPLQLDFVEGRLAVSNLCNRMGGSYAIEGGRLVLGDMVSTLMACADEALMARDHAANERLQGRFDIALEPGERPRLVLSGADGSRYAFEGMPTPETRFGGPGQTVFLEVAAQRRPCSHPLIPDMRCLQVREVGYDENGLRIGEEAEWGHFYADIEGFAHEEGVRNVLRVKRYAIADPPADAPSQAYVLDMVVESELERP